MGQVRRTASSGTEAACIQVGKAIKIEVPGSVHMHIMRIQWVQVGALAMVTPCCLRNLFLQRSHRQQRMWWTDPGVVDIQGTSRIINEQTAYKLWMEVVRRLGCLVASRLSQHCQQSRILQAVSVLTRQRPPPFQNHRSIGPQPAGVDAPYLWQPSRQDYDLRFHPRHLRFIASSSPHDGHWPMTSGRTISSYCSTCNRNNVVHWIARLLVIVHRLSKNRNCNIHSHWNHQH